MHNWNSSKLVLLACEAIYFQQHWTLKTKTIAKSIQVYKNSACTILITRYDAHQKYVVQVFFALLDLETVYDKSNKPEGPTASSPHYEPSGKYSAMK